MLFIPFFSETHFIDIKYPIFHAGWAQSRGSSRYTPSDHFDEDITRAPRPTRGAAARRQRVTTKAPEPPAIEEEAKDFQVHEVFTDHSLSNRNNRNFY